MKGCDFDVLVRGCACLNVERIRKLAFLDGSGWRNSRMKDLSNR